MEREEWLKKRRQGITGTDIAAILGFSKWKSAFDVWHDKVHEQKYQDVEDINGPIYWGNNLEKVVAFEWAKRNRRPIRQGSLVTKGIFLGTPDFFIDGNENGAKGGLEIKTASQYVADKWGGEDTEQIPNDYFVQVQWYMGLLDMDRWHVAVLIGGNDYRQYVINRRDNLIKTMQQKANEFWQKNVLKEIMPAITGSKSETNYLKQNLPQENKDIFEANEEQIQLMAHLKTIKEDLNVLEQKKLAIENELKLAIGKNGGLIHDAWKCTHSVRKGRDSVDWKAIQKELKITQDIIDKHTKKGKSYRVFSAKFGE